MTIEIGVPFWAVLTHSLPPTYSNANERHDLGTVPLRPLPYVQSGFWELLFVLSGGLRTESHIERKLAAIEVVEKRRIHVVKARSLKKLTPFE